MRMRHAGLVVLAAFVLAGCAGPGGFGSGQCRGETQAIQALARWAAALAAGGDKVAFLPVGQLVGQVGDWELEVGGNNKLALLSGQVTMPPDLGAPPPATGTVTWTDGRPNQVPPTSAWNALRRMVESSRTDCDGCKPLEVTDAKLSTVEIQTSRGTATVPAWEYTLRGTKAKITYPAAEPGAAVTVSPPPWDPMNTPAGMSVERATVSADGVHLTVTFTGRPGTRNEPCGAGYTARAIESPNAVVVLLREIRHGANETCLDIGAARTAEATLDSPLGERAVLEVRQGLPVPVTQQG